MKFYIYRICVLFFLISCSGKKAEDKAKEEPVKSTAYHFNEPSEVYELPAELKEISGLTTLSEKYLLCTEDESGTLYLFNLQKSSIEEKIPWGKKGDYEGVALINSNAYVLESSGKIFKISNFRSENIKVTELETGMDKGCDAEGLTFLPERKSLLIACKEGGSEIRKVFEVDLEQGVRKHEPFLQMELADLEDYLVQTGLDKFSIELRKLLSPQGGSGVMFPSGIAFHPLTGDLYILSAKSKLLAIYSGSVLKEVAELSNELFRQPESITFTPNGDMYIGNEGKGGDANILKFVYDQQK